MLIRLFSKLALAAGLAGTLAITGCDSGSSSSAPGSSSSSSSSTSSSGTLELSNVYVAFPPPVSHTQEGSVRVRGVVQDSAGISEIRVNGATASTEDNWASWTADVPLAEGVNTIEVASVDNTSVTTVMERLSVTRSLALTSPRSMVYDSDNDRLLVVDASRNTVVAVETGTGRKSQFSPSADGDTLIDKPLDMVLHRPSNKLIIRQNSTDHPLVSVDLTSGEQSYLPLQYPEDLDESLPFAVSAAGTEVYVAASETFYVDAAGNRVTADTEDASRTSMGMIHRADPNSGQLQPLSRYSFPGNAVALGGISAMADHPESPHLFVLDSTTIVLQERLYNVRSIKKVDKSSGERSWFFPQSERDAEDDAEPVDEGNEDDSATEEEPVATDDEEEEEEPATQFSLSARIQEMHLDYPNNALWVLDQNRLVRIDLQTAVATVVYGNNLPEGIKYSSYATQSLAPDFGNGVLYTVDDALDRVLATRVSDNTRTLVTGEGADDPESAATLVSPAAVAIDIFSNQLYITDKAQLSLSKMDLTTGTRTTLVAGENDTAEKPSLYYPAALDFLGQSERLLVVGNSRSDCIISPANIAPRVLSVDATNGNRTILATYSTAVYQVCDAIYSAGTRTIYTVEKQFFSSSQIIGAIGRIRLLDNNQSEYSVLSRTGTPDSVHPLNNPSALALDEERNRLLVTDGMIKGVVAVDLSSGARTVLSPHDAAVPMNAPKDIMLSPTGAEAWILDSTLDGIVAVDLESGQRSVVASAPEGLDGLATPSAMALHPVFNYMVIADPGRATVMALDLETGELVRIAR